MAMFEFVSDPNRIRLGKVSDRANGFTVGQLDFGAMVARGVDFRSWDFVMCAPQKGSETPRKGSAVRTQMRRIMGRPIREVIADGFVRVVCARPWIDDHRLAA